MEVSGWRCKSCWLQDGQPEAAAKPSSHATALSASGSLGAPASSQPLADLNGRQNGSPLPPAYKALSRANSPPFQPDMDDTASVVASPREAGSLFTANDGPAASTAGS